MREPRCLRQAIDDAAVPQEQDPGVVAHQEIRPERHGNDEEEQGAPVRRLEGHPQRDREGDHKREPRGRRGKPDRAREYLEVIRVQHEIIQKVSLEQELHIGVERVPGPDDAAVRAALERRHERHEAKREHEQHADHSHRRGKKPGSLPCVAHERLLIRRAPEPHSRARRGSPPHPGESAGGPRRGFARRRESARLAPA